MKRRFLKAGVFAAALVPLALLIRNIATSNLGANPVEAVEVYTGVWTLRFLALTLLVTPLRRLTGWNELVRYRRMLGLFAFFYANVHLLSYLGIDNRFDVQTLLHDVVKHPYVTVGMAAYLMLIPLAITSTTGWIRRLGGRRWRALHRLIYAVVILGTIHYYWSVKLDVQRPLLYGALFAVLLGYRVWARRAKREGRAAAPRARGTATRVRMEPVSARPGDPRTPGTPAPRA